MAATFSPGLRPILGLGAFTAQSASDVASTTIIPGFRSSTGIGARSALDIAAAAIAPEGLGPLAPLWKLLYGFIKRKANIDITSITTKALIAFGAAVGIRFVWSYAKPLVLEYFTSSITLPVEHKTGRGIQMWLDSQGTSSANRHVKYTVRKVDFNMVTQTDDFDGDKRTAMTGGLFLFQNRPLYFSFQDTTTKDCPAKFVPGNPDDYGYKEEFELSGEQVTVYSLDWSGGLLQRFVKHVSAEEVKETRVTPVFTVSTGGPRLWEQRIKPIRPLGTIDLDSKVKADLVSDVDRFLSPNRAKWYSARGIPYKRGILLQGPPGTGKSSISLALAGHMGGPLYTIAIGEVRGEGHLKQLFESAKYGACVLLEDVDSAGIGRENMNKASNDTQSARGDGAKTRISTKELNMDDDYDDDDDSRSHKTKHPISLSGLLNAIDALADGVVLIMTTNEPENLDKALIRPGRIDKQIHVGNASQAVAENIFTRFYSEYSSENDDSVSVNHTIAELATQFAGKTPDLKFTPAEIQGFLIPLSDSPEKAIVDADQWVSDLLFAKMVGKNVITEEARKATRKEEGGATA